MNIFSIIIPTFNRPVQLKACLEALTRQLYPKNLFEVIVVNDGGNADLDEIVGTLQGSLQIQLVRQENTGPAGARNNGVAHATGKFIAFTDDDCTPDESWLEVLSRNLEEDPSRMYGGHTVDALKNNVYSSASQTLIDFLYSYYNADPQRAQFFTSNNMAMTRHMFVAAGGFNTSFYRASAEDRELCDRWLHLGYRMIFLPDAVILHHHELNFGSFWKQHFNYGAGAWRFLECRQMRGNGKLNFEPLRFYLKLVASPWKQNLRHPLYISLLMLLSQIANATGFVWAILKGMSRQPGLPKPADS
ncbi:MAG: glycosyltransferase [Lysobacterales bacterium]